MLIDWFTVAAQAINFLILVWLLKRYLYQPILNAIDEREQRIVDEIDDAAAKQAQAKTERDIFRDKNSQFDQERDDLMEHVKDDADLERDRLFAQAQQAVKALHIKHQQIIASEAKNLKQLLSRKTSDEVFAIARKTLHDLATTGLEQQIVQVFIARLNGLKAAPKAALSSALKTTSAPVLLSSAFNLSETDRHAIHQAIKDVFDADIDLEFFISKDLIAGIELKSNGQKLGWNIADYLLSLEQEVGTVLQESIKAVNKEPLKNKANTSTNIKPNENTTNARVKSQAMTDKPVTTVGKADE